MEGGRSERRAHRSTMTEARAVGDERSSLDRRLDKTRAIKQGMMQQLLTGAIRLPIPDADRVGEPIHDA